MQDTLERCREAFGEPPRLLGALARRNLGVKKPKGLEPDDPLNRHFKNLDAVLETGKVTWGYMVRASENLFSKGRGLGKAELLYSRADDVDPIELEKVEEELAKYQGAMSRDSSINAILSHLGNERDPVHEMRIPDSLSSEQRTYLSTTIVARKQIPSGVLQSQLTPILLHPSLGFVHILPHKYWPQDFKKWWLAKKIWDP